MISHGMIDVLTSDGMIHEWLLTIEHNSPMYLPYTCILLPYTCMGAHILEGVRGAQSHLTQVEHLH